jgi:hypothetical protein
MPRRRSRYKLKDLLRNYVKPPSKLLEAVESGATTTMDDADWPPFAALRERRLPGPSPRSDNVAQPPRRQPCRVGTAHRPPFVVGHAHLTTARPMTTHKKHRYRRSKEQ